MTAAETERLFLRLTLDRHRPRLLLPPFPKAVPPPPPPSKERLEVRMGARCTGGATSDGYTTEF